MGIVDLLLRVARLQCGSCRYQLKANDLKGHKTSEPLHCPRCHEVIPTKNFQQSPTSFDKSKAKASPQIKVTQRSGELNLHVRWLGRETYFILGFASVWNSFVFFIGYMLYFHKGFASLPVTPLMMIGTFALIGILLKASALSAFVNSTHISVKSTQIEFVTKPLSFSGKKSYKVSEIANISLEKIYSGRQNNRQVYTHYVCIYFHNGKSQRLCRVRDLNDGMYVEKILEEHLSLKDNPSLDRVSV